MATQSQDTAAYITFTDLKTTLSTHAEVTDFMQLFESRYASVMTKVYDLDEEDYDGRLSLLNELKAALDYGMAKSTNIQEYDLVRKGSVHIQEGKVICDGKSIDWDAFCAVRNQPATISGSTDLVNVGTHQMDLEQYLAARKAHRNIPDKEYYPDVPWGMTAKQEYSNDDWALRDKQSYDSEAWDTGDHDFTPADNDWDAPFEPDTSEQWNAPSPTASEHCWYPAPKEDSYDGCGTPASSRYEQW